MTAKLAENEMDQVTTQALNLDEQVAHLLRRAHQRASSLFLSVLGEHQLTPTQFFAMARLHERGQLSQNRLGRLAAMDPATIQGVIRRLEERDYIQRTPDANDRRRMVLRLTSSGISLVDQLLDHADGVSEAILEPLETSERDLFVDLLKRLT
ncbi:MarR family winged helix-turn-helix transcriptional regulator [Algihabitans albus]|uniref:MarR family winged helix-turn-helix transcriptional regulator n=1 Tax=Algihabitans albus TaxID=2164067 RepID=UPI001F1A8F9A|nr:MarR family transcriptional regulator [Algihabitans albus]